jgi:hypothetical protein
MRALASFRLTAVHMKSLIPFDRIAINQNNLRVLNRRLIQHCERSMRTYLRVEHS